MLFFLLQFGITFVTIFLRGVQTHNVINFNYKGAAITSVAMAVTNVAFIGLVAHDPLSSLIPVAIGAVLGILSSMKFKERSNK